MIFGFNCNAYRVTRAPILISVVSPQLVHACGEEKAMLCIRGPSILRPTAPDRADTFEPSIFRDTLGVTE